MYVSHALNLVHLCACPQPLDITAELNKKFGKPPPADLDEEEGSLHGSAEGVEPEQEGRKRSKSKSKKKKRKKKDKQEGTYLGWGHWGGYLVVFYCCE